jgi:hypothetical protein
MSADGPTHTGDRQTTSPSWSVALVTQRHGLVAWLAIGLYGPELDLEHAHDPLLALNIAQREGCREVTHRPVFPATTCRA